MTSKYIYRYLKFKNKILPGSGILNQPPKLQRQNAEVFYENYKPIPPQVKRQKAKDCLSTENMNKDNKVSSKL